MITGPILVLVTWFVAVLVIAAMGLAPALVAARGALNPRTMRSALWWGLLFAAIVILATNSWLPLRSGSAAIVFVIVVVLLAVIGIWLIKRRKQSALTISSNGRWWLLPLFIAIALAVVYLAVAAMGPVTNYDSGLYHLGAIKYAGDFATIPGLANLYFPFGYNNSLFPLAAFLGNGPWDGDGYRLINGLLMMLMATDLVIRLLQRKYSVGTFVLFIGFTASWVPLIALSDYWVTSPTSDSSVFILALVAVSYFSDALTSKKAWQGDAAVAVVIGLLLVSLRQTMAAFLISLIVIIVIRAWRLRSDTGEIGKRASINKALWLMVFGSGIALALVQSGRDYLLSGWLQYPLSLFTFKIDWAAADPIWARTATLGAARDPANLWEAAGNWAWIPGWFGRLPSQWEPFELALLLVVASICLITATRLTHAVRWRSLVLALVPSVVTALVWFFASPPSFRFAWGPLLGLGVIPLGWALYALAQSRSIGRLIAPVLTLGLSATLVLLLGYCAVARLDTTWTEDRAFTLGPVQINYQVTPIPVPETKQQQLPGGLVIVIPVPSDQCWDVYPLCVGQNPGAIRQRGQTLQDGFTAN
ncbi:MAG: hypothetical protein EXQ60_08005 [Candidatus Nanopelagicales bacterium]|nr:hypothetical protein [Candidatus Nanopelagicales bacterium]